MNEADTINAAVYRYIVDYSYDVGSIIVDTHIQDDRVDNITIKTNRYDITIFDDSTFDVLLKNGYESLSYNDMDFIFDLKDNADNIWRIIEEQLSDDKEARSYDETKYAA